MLFKVVGFFAGMRFNSAMLNIFKLKIEVSEHMICTSIQFLVQHHFEMENWFWFRFHRLTPFQGIL